MYHSRPIRYPSLPNRTHAATGLGAAFGIYPAFSMTVPRVKRYSKHGKKSEKREHFTCGLVSIVRGYLLSEGRKTNGYITSQHTYLEQTVVKG
jgi:hypothetical protein